MLQTGQGAEFALEPMRACFGARRREEGFDRHGLIGLAIARAVYDAHAPLSQRRLDLVAVGQQRSGRQRARRDVRRSGNFRFPLLGWITRLDWHGVSFLVSRQLSGLKIRLSHRPYGEDACPPGLSRIWSLCATSRFVLDEFLRVRTGLPRLYL
jgi:hypothetical protein